MKDETKRAPRILFMGEQEDPDMDNAVARGFPRIYDATGAEVESDTLLAEPKRAIVEKKKAGGK